MNNFIASFFTALTINPFLQMALIAGFLASIAGGVVGSYVVVKRIVFIAGSIAHSVLGGMGLFLYLRSLTGYTFFSPLTGALFFAILSAIIIGWIHLNYRQREDTVIAAVWAAGMATGVIFISLTPGNNTALLNFLFGNILWASQSDIYLLITLDIILIITSLLCHRRFLAICFDETQAYLQKVHVKTFYFLLITLVGITVVLLIQVIGAILIISMLSLPAATANLFTHRLSRMIFIAVGLSWIFTFFGIYTSYSFNWPPGATIAIISAAGFLGVTLAKRSKTRS